MFRFAHPELLYLLIVIPLLIVFLCGDDPTKKEGDSRIR